MTQDDPQLNENLLELIKVDREYFKEEMRSALHRFAAESADPYGTFPTSEAELREILHLD